MSGMFDNLKNQLKNLNNAKLVVGVQAEAGTNFHGQTVSSDTNVLKIAYVHEFGYDIKVTDKMRAWLHYNGIHLKKETDFIHIPERSYIRRGQREGKQSFNTAFKDLIGKMFNGELNSEQVLELLGQQAVTDTISNMGVDTKPVSGYTLENRKKSRSSTPLTDTGNLQNHITYLIKKGGG